MILYDNYTLFDLDNQIIFLSRSKVVDHAKFKSQFLKRLWMRSKF